jgi:hypothetical protein
MRGSASVGLRTKNHAELRSSDESEAQREALRALGYARTIYLERRTGDFPFSIFDFSFVIDGCVRTASGSDRIKQPALYSK